MSGFSTPDRFVGVREEEGIILEDEATDPVQAGEVRYSGGEFKLQEAIGVFNPRTGGGISEAQHEALDTLAHELVENSFEELTYSGNNVTNATVWTSSAKTTKIRETQMTYSDNKATQVIDIQYNGAGVEVYRLTSVLTYSGNKVQDITVTRTP